MNNLGAALLHKQKQSVNNNIDLAVIQQRFNSEIQQLMATINGLKVENNTLKVKNDELKAENDTLKAENKPKNNTIPNVSFVFI
jgi:FtsZ-binding cell division protein ZapB